MNVPVVAAAAPPNVVAPVEPTVVSAPNGETVRSVGHPIVEGVRQVAQLVPDVRKVADRHLLARVPVHRRAQVDRVRRRRRLRVPLRPVPQVLLDHVLQHARPHPLRPPSPELHPSREQPPSPHRSPVQRPSPLPNRGRAKAEPDSLLPFDCGQRIEHHNAVLRPPRAAQPRPGHRIGDAPQMR